ncbi:PREDICTED: chordin-like [Branchiostoma belcheri]|uniref:Chordin n=1 Tax=Branchiostoma belcheri TaxID=7741 RepID=A0A6P4Z909_BRABE|nr:PREDICTED: chordin-like [Branchiostoma belcheri]
MLFLARSAVCLLLAAATVRASSSLIPINSDDGQGTKDTVPGCSFGGKYYGMREEWHPDLGEPFGIMFCIRCRCVQTSRKGKVDGRVSCKNIKKECPILTCPNPVISPKQCCSTCPEGTGAAQMNVSTTADAGLLLAPSRNPLKPAEILKPAPLPKQSNDQERMEKTAEEDSEEDVYSVLLTGSQMYPPVPTAAAARGRLTLWRKNLHYSIQFSGMARPRIVRFTDRLGTVLFEHEVRGTSQPLPSQVCGVWRNLHPVYVRYLQRSMVYVTLVTPSWPAGEIRGKVQSDRVGGLETFGSLLTPNADDAHAWLGAGGEAVLVAGPDGTSVDFMVMFNGLWDGKENSLVPVHLQLIHPGWNFTLRETHADITAQYNEFAEVWTNLTEQELDWMMRGELRLTVTAGNLEHPREISGPITLRQTCDTIHAVLSGSQAIPRTETGAAGSAIFHIHTNGSVDYQISTAGLRSRVTSLTLEFEEFHTGARRVVRDLTPTYNPFYQTATGMEEGWNLLDIHSFLHSDLWVNVHTEEFPAGQVRGRIEPLVYNGHRARETGLPTVLAGVNVFPPQRTGAAGHAWLSIDGDCSLHYEILVAGLNRDVDTSVSAHLHGFAEIGEMTTDWQNEHKMVLKSFYGSKAMGQLKDIDEELLSHIDQGRAYIQVSTKRRPFGEIRGHVQIPNRCHSRHNLYEEEEQDSVAMTPDLDYERVKEDPNSCYFEGEYRGHGSTWVPAYDQKCSTCKCQKSTVICDPVACPQPDCYNPVIPEGECCPKCPDEIQNNQATRSQQRNSAVKGRKSGIIVQQETEGCYFDGDKKFHSYDEEWHPYVPPFGYIKCAICVCEKGTNQVNCNRVRCPVLRCKNPIRVSPTDCCKQCPASEANEAPGTDDVTEEDWRHVEEESDQSFVWPTETTITGTGTKTAQGGCRFGKDAYQNGESWNPKVPPFGVMKCIQCFCKNGAADCRRPKCEKLNCNPSDVIKEDGECCPRCRGK